MVEIIIKEVIRFRKYERFHDSGGFPDKRKKEEEGAGPYFSLDSGRYISFIYFPLLTTFLYALIKQCVLVP